LHSNSKYLVDAQSPKVTLNMLPLSRGEQLT